MKHNLSAILLLVCSLSYAQVGINNEQPNTTLDITAKKGTTDKDGILIPRVTKSELNAKAANTYSSTQNSVMVFVTDIAAGTSSTSSAQTTKIVEPGFYYFKDTEWLPIGSSSPWLVQNSTTTATKDSQNIYHTNKVSIGDNLSTTSRDEELFVLGNSRFQTKNDGPVGADDKQTYYYANRDQFYVANVNRDATGNDQSRADMVLDNNGNSPNTSNFRTARLELSAGSKITGSNRFGGYAINPSDDVFSNGLGTHTFTTWLPTTNENSVVAIDEKGLKIGYSKNLIDDNVGINGLGEILFPPDPSWELNATTYYLPKTSPTTGQVLMFDQVVNPGTGIEPYTTTKWETPVSNSTTNIYTNDGSIGTNRVVSLTSATNTLTFTRTATPGATDTPVISTNGSIQTIALRLDSDARLKENIKPIDGNLALQLKPVTYTWNKAGKDKGGNDKIQYGFIAQEVEKAIPDAVFTDKDGYKSVNYIEVIPVLTQKIKDQDQIIKELIKRVEKLETGKK